VRLSTLSGDVENMAHRDTDRDECAKGSVNIPTLNDGVDKMEQRDGDGNGNGNDFAEHAHVNLPPVRILRRHHVEMALTAAAARAAPASTREGGELRRVHAVTATTIAVPAGGDGVTRSVTAWIHSATVGIEPGCFREIPHVSRVLVRPHTDPSDAVAATHMHSAAVLGVLIRKLGSFKRDLVEWIRHA
jgi:hypothetical protein